MSLEPNPFASSADALVPRTEPSAAPQLAIRLEQVRTLAARRGLVAFFTIVAAVVLWSLTQRYDVEPYAVLLGLFAIVISAVATRTCAPVLVAGFLYVGNFKTTPAAGFSLTDPTFMILMLCCAALLLECLLCVSGVEQLSLTARFANQGRGILLFLLFLLVIALSDFYTTAPNSGLIKLERIAVFATVAFFAPLILFKRPTDLNQFLATCVILSLALSIRDLAELFHPSAAVLAGNEDITHIGDAELIGTAIVILIYHQRFGRRRSLQLVCLSLLAIGLAASAARSAALSLLIVLVISSSVLRSDIVPTPRKNIFLGVLVVIVAAVGVQWIGQLPAARAKLAHKEDELGRLLKGSFLAGGTAEQRMTFYRRSLVAISEKPLLGWGVGGWGPFFIGMDDRNAIPHDFVLESAVEQGLIGCSTLLAFLVATAAALRKIIRLSGPHFVFLVPAFLLPVLIGLVSGGLDNRLLWFWCGAIFAVSRMVHHQLKTPRDGLRI